LRQGKLPKNQIERKLFGDLYAGAQCALFAPVVKYLAAAASP
jgi:hypothetical protein